jgi:EAL domain-containing protein (putative c-di-GMP-specific phosphodiesterase class I)
LRCDEIQGYFYSKPLPAETLVSLFEPQINTDSIRS